jgi:hypothetical protein
VVKDAAFLGCCKLALLAADVGCQERCAQQHLPAAARAAPSPAAGLPPSAAVLKAHLLLLLLLPLLWDGRSRGGAMKSQCKEHTGMAMFRQGSNKEARSMRAQWQAARMSMHEGVAGLPGTLKVF